MNVLGVSAFYHDSAAALVRDGEIIAAAQEERFSRIRHDAGFPVNSCRAIACMPAAFPSRTSIISFSTTSRS